MDRMDDRLEILIGRYLDGEISPAQEQMLEDELEHNAEARQLFEQLQSLDETVRATVDREVLDRGDRPEAIFERAWRQGNGAFWRHIVASVGAARFTSGLAAGFLLAVLLHFVLAGSGGRVTGPLEPPGRRLTSSATGTVARAEVDGWMNTADQPVVHDVDWYTFTDDEGNQWLVEGVREGVVRPVAYGMDLCAVVGFPERTERCVRCMGQ